MNTIKISHKVIRVTAVICTLAIIALFIWIITEIKQKAYLPIGYVNTVVLSYSKGLHDGLEAYIRTHDKPVAWSFSKQWKTSISNTGKLPLQVEQEKIAMEFLKAQDLYDTQASNLMIKFLEYFEKGNK